MKVRRMLHLLLTAVVVMSCMVANVGAVELSENLPVITEAELNVSRATDRFSITVQANVLAQASEAFSLDKGETVTISATYSPTDSAVNIGVIDKSGNYTYIEGSDGNLNGKIVVRKTGDYILVVENSSSTAITISGTVRY